MKPVARNLTVTGWGFLSERQYVIFDRDSKSCESFRGILKAADLKIIRLPPRSPNMNAFCERWVLSVKAETLSRLVLFGQDGLRRALSDFVGHYHSERNHQGKDNLLLFPGRDHSLDQGEVKCQERLGGLLKFYSREAA